MSVTVRVPAKINLHLQVQPLRADGFHDLHTVFHAVSLFDEIRAERATGLSISCTDPAVPSDMTNLACQAAQRLAGVAGVEPDVHLVLTKAIPVAGGMAGGSADAAAALVACAELWGVRADLPALAAELGSDVAFPLLGGTAIGTGRGEVLTPIESAELHWAFAFADFGISAGAAYRELDRLRHHGVATPMTDEPSALIEALRTGELDAIGALLRNDLQPAALALAPSLDATLQAGVAAGAVAAIVSGSGPTCAFLCRSSSHAVDVAAQLRERGHRTATAFGPVPGAQVTG